MSKLHFHHSVLPTHYPKKNQQQFISYKTSDNGVIEQCFWVTYIDLKVLGCRVNSVGGGDMTRHVVQRHMGYPYGVRQGNDQSPVGTMKGPTFAWKQHWISLSGVEGVMKVKGYPQTKKKKKTRQGAWEDDYPNDSARALCRVPQGESKQAQTG